jgi:hypothetical protein
MRNKTEQGQQKIASRLDTHIRQGEAQARREEARAQRERELIDAFKEMAAELRGLRHDLNPPLEKPAYRPPGAAAGSMPE